MNLRFKKVFKHKVVNKTHTINPGVDEFPRYVLEYLIDNYCSEETFHASCHVSYFYSENVILSPY